jgi:hypothetical protein
MIGTARQQPKILAAHRYIFSVNALNCAIWVLNTSVVNSSFFGVWLLYGCFIRTEQDGNAREGKSNQTQRLKTGGLKNR